MQELPINYQRMLQAQRSPETFADHHHARYHEAQSGPQDTAAKELARESGIETVKCACGAEFSSAVR